MESKVLLALSVSLLVIVVLSKLIKSLVVAKPKLNLPPAPWMLPVIGSLHHLMSSTRSPHQAMSRLANKYGPIMMLRLGEVPALVLSSPEAAEEVLKTNDLKFADRNLNATLNALTYNGTDLTFARYGERWRQLRKICVMELLNPGPARLLSYRHIREEEVARFIQTLAGTGGAPVDLTKMIYKFINDTFVRESVGSRCKYQDEYLDAFRTALRQTSSVTVADIFPSSRLLQLLGTAPRKVLAARSRMQRVLQQVIKEKMEAMDRGDHQEGPGNDCFLSVLIRLQKERSAPVDLTDNTVLALMFDMFAAGSETSSITLTWCMTELLRFPAVMAKAQAEVRDAFKGKNKIIEQDLEGLTYLKLVIKETLRLHPPGPVLIPRVCRETCQIMGYDIPKGTVIFINVWSIGRDPKYWDKPLGFKPERFENNNLDYKGTNFEYLPFGAGRRVCPGINLGLDNIELALASFLYHFDWKLPHGIESKDVDVSEASGMAASKKTSLILHPITRIPPANI
ncbi:hypothetical protein ACP4OV_025936 [Aristida adscensionis]